MDRGAWRGTVHGVAKSHTGLKRLFACIESYELCSPGGEWKECHRLPQLRTSLLDLPTVLHGRRQWHPTPVLLPGNSLGRRSLIGCSPVGSLEVGHDWVTSLSLFTFMHWRRKWQPTPVFLPGESQGWGSLVGCCLWGSTESDMTEQLSSSPFMGQQSWGSSKVGGMQRSLEWESQAAALLGLAHPWFLLYCLLLHPTSFTSCLSIYCLLLFWEYSPFLNSG